MATITLTAASILPNETSPTTAVFNSFPVIAGETLTAGMFVYKKASDGRYWLADNSTAEKSTVAGIVANGAVAGQRFNLIQRDTELPVGTGPVPGRLYGLSSTPGKMCDIADVATTGSIYLLVLTQANSSVENTLRFNFSTPVAGILND